MDDDILPANLTLYDAYHLHVRAEGGDDVTLHSPADHRSTALSNVHTPADRPAQVE